MIGPLTYRFIDIVRSTDLDTHAGRPLYWIRNRRSGDSIGQVFYYPTWRCWIARFKEESVWSADCLTDVSRALEIITERWTEDQ